MKQSKNGILIVGLEDFVDHYRRALTLVEGTETEYSNIVYQNLRRIKQGPFMFLNVLTGSYFRKGLDELEWDAGGLVHEAKHIADFWENPLAFLTRSTRETERRALEVQDRFQRSIGYKGVDIERLLATEWWKKTLFERRY